jgi:hypothetical protein
VGDLTQRRKGAEVEKPNRQVVNYGSGMLANGRSSRELVRAAAQRASGAAIFRAKAGLKICGNLCNLWIKLPGFQLAIVCLYITLSGCHIVIVCDANGNEHQTFVGVGAAEAS